MSVQKKSKIRAREVFIGFLPLLAAMSLQQFLSLFVNLLDNFMLGAYMESAMSAATVVNQIQTVLANLIIGSATGVSVLGSQYWGKKDTSTIKLIIAAGLKVSFIMGLIFTIVTAIIPGPILSLFTTDAEILAQGKEYLSIICWTYVIYSVSAHLMISLQSVETAFIGTVMSASTIVINGCLNYTFIYGNFGAPELGIKGAAYATLTSRCIELVIVVIYIICIDKKLQMRFREFFKLRTGIFKDYFNVALPIMISGAGWGVGLAIQTAVLGHIGSTAIGASSIAVTVAQIFLVASYASANATAVTMGKVVGNNENDVIRPLSRRFQLFFIVMGLAMGVLFFFLRRPILSLYNVSEETEALAEKFIIIMSISVVGSIYEYPVMGGIIAGGGDPRYEAVIDASFMWLFMIPMSCLSAFVFEWGPVVTFIFLKVDQLIKCIPNAIYCNSYKWIRNRTRPAPEETQ